MNIFRISQEILQFPFRDLFRISKLEALFRAKTFSLLSYQRLSALYDLSEAIDVKTLEGDIVECGVWNGGSASVLAHNLPKNNRRLWLFDSWEGLPEPGRLDISFQGVPGIKGSARGSEKNVQILLFDKMGLDQKRIHLVKGWYQETLARSLPQIPLIGLLHLDCDWYESVKLCLNTFYDRIVPGGIIILDDYGHWKGCREAIHEFLKERSLNINLIKIDYTAVYFCKPVSGHTN